MAEETPNFVQQEQRFQKALLVLFGLGTLLIAFSSYTTRGFLPYGASALSPPAAFVATTPPPGTIGASGIAGTTPVVTGVTKRGTQGPRGGLGDVTNDIPFTVAENFGRDAAAGSGAGTGTGTGAGGNGGGSGSGGGGSGGQGAAGASGGSPGAAAGSGDGALPGSFASTLPGGSGGGGGGTIGNGTGTTPVNPPVVVAVPEPGFWLIAILGFAGIGGRLRQERAKAWRRSTASVTAGSRAI